MVNEQEVTATSSNVTVIDGNKHDENFSNNHMIISKRQVAPDKAASSFSCSMGLESSSTALGISPHEELSIKQVNVTGESNPNEESSHHNNQGKNIVNNSIPTSFQNMATVKETQPVQKKRGRGRPRKQEKDLSYLKEEESSRSSLNSINSIEKETMEQGVESSLLIESNFSSLTVSQRDHNLSTTRNSSYIDNTHTIDSSQNSDCYADTTHNPDLCKTSILSNESENLEISDNNKIENLVSKNRSSNRIREREKLSRAEDVEQKKIDFSNMHSRNSIVLNDKATSDQSETLTLQNGHVDERLWSQRTKTVNGVSMGTFNNFHNNSEHVANTDEDSFSLESREISDTSREGSLRGDNELNSTSPLKVKSRWHNSSENERRKSNTIIDTNNAEFDISNITPSSNLTSDKFSADYQALDSTGPIKSKRETRTRSERRMSSKRTSPPQKDVRPQINDSFNDTNSMAVKDYSNIEIVTPAQQLEIDQRLKSFDHISTNAFVCQRRRNKQTRDMECDCSLSKEDMALGKKGCGDDCLNRLLMVECNKSCSLGDNCGNKRFQKLENAPTEVFKTEYKGVGLRASSQIGRDSFIMEYVGEVLDPQRFHKRAKKYSQNDVKHFYFMALSTDYIIDATSKGNISRFINHSCDPNAETQKWTVDGELRVGFFSKRKIKPGEEITFDYKYERYGQHAQKCYCGATNCRGWLGGEPEKDDPESSDEENVEQDEESSLSSEDPDEKEPVKSYEKSECDASSPMEDPGFSPSWSQQISPPKQRKYNKRRLRRTPRKIKNFETDEFEEDIERLKMTGIRTKSHTVDLCRLMVRVTETKTRLILCHLLLDADSPCRRLFLDYHGLKILNSWMADLKWESLIDLEVKIALEDVLGILNIPHKTMLVESNIWQAVTNWATDDISNRIQTKYMNLNQKYTHESSNNSTSNSLIPSNHSQTNIDMEIDSATSNIGVNSNGITPEPSSSPCDETMILQKLKNINQKLSENTNEENQQGKEENLNISNAMGNSLSNNEQTGSCTLPDYHRLEGDGATNSENVISIQEQEIASKASLVQEKAQQLLSVWQNLKEVFKIPRKELVKLRAEHEKELDEAEQHLKKNQVNHGDDLKYTGNFHRFPGGCAR